MLFTEMGKTVGGADFGEKNTRCLAFDMLSLRCLLDIQVKLWSRQFDMNLEFRGALSSS